MSWIDLIRMSSSSLKRRKLRTFLTVLGVVIGVASIVVMISLGLGMQESMYRQVEQSGGMTSITVTGKQTDNSMSMSTGSSDDKKSKKYITDDVVEKLQGLEHVKGASPVLTIQTSILKGKYIANVQLVGMSHDALKEQNIKLKAGGTLPKTEGKALELVVGNGVIASFYDKTSGKGYWDTRKLPDIDIAKDQMFLILDQESYQNSQASNRSDNSSKDGAAAGSGDAAKAKKRSAKKYLVHASGVVEGNVESYNMSYSNVYCDLNILKELLKKEFSGRVIPGQPSTKSGKPYKYFTYTSATVQADDMKNVDALSQEIREMGYQVTTNAEFMNSMKSQFAMIQAVLGGIGAVSLLVAAIGIANTMMMSIYERTKEIGVLKVLGCSLKNIKQLFLLEAAFIGFIGGVVGNLLSFAMSFVINMLKGVGSAMGVEGNISYIPVWLVVVSMLFAVVVGMIAGYFPALRAMRLSPLAAIRNE